MGTRMPDMTSKSLFSSSATIDEAKTTLQVAYQVTMEAYSDGLLNDFELQATVTELKSTFRSQLIESGDYDEAELRQLEQEAVAAANDPTGKHEVLSPVEHRYHQGGAPHMSIQDRSLSDSDEEQSVQAPSPSQSRNVRSQAPVPQPPRAAPSAPSARSAQAAQSAKSAQSAQVDVGTSGGQRPPGLRKQTGTRPASKATARQYGVLKGGRAGDPDAEPPRPDAQKGTVHFAPNPLSGISPQKGAGISPQKDSRRGRIPEVPKEGGEGKGGAKMVEPVAYPPSRKVIGALHSPRNSGESEANVIVDIKLNGELNATGVTDKEMERPRRNSLPLLPQQALVRKTRHAPNDSRLPGSNILRRFRELTAGAAVIIVVMSILVAVQHNSSELRLAALLSGIPIFALSAVLLVLHRMKNSQLMVAALTVLFGVSLVGCNAIMAASSSLNLTCSLKQSSFQDCMVNSCPALFICLEDDQQNGDCTHDEISSCGCEAPSTDACENFVVLAGYLTAIAVGLLGTAVTALSILAVICFELENMPSIQSVSLEDDPRSTASESFVAGDSDIESQL